MLNTNDEKYTLFSAIKLLWEYHIYDYNPSIIIILLGSRWLVKK